MHERAQERRRLTPEQRAVLLKLEEITHQQGALSGGERWHAVQQRVLLEAVALIRELRRVD
jgi:hypothetical protein